MARFGVVLAAAFLAGAFFTAAFFATAFFAVVVFVVAFLEAALPALLAVFFLLLLPVAILINSLNIVTTRYLRAQIPAGDSRPCTGPPNPGQIIV